MSLSSPAALDYGHAPLVVSIQNVSPGGDTPWAVILGTPPPLDAIMRVPTRRQGRSRATYRSRVSGMQSLLKRERSPFTSLVSTTTDQPENIKLAPSGAEPPSLSEVEGAWEGRGGGSV